MKRIFVDFIAFLKSPVLTAPGRKPRWRDFWRVVALYFAGLVVVSALMQVASQGIFWFSGEEILQEGRTSIQRLAALLGWLIIPAIWFLIPFMEELMFRLPLISNTRNLRTGVIAVIVYTMIAFMAGNSTVVWKLIVPLGALLFIAISYLCRHDRVIFYSSVFLFGFLHLANYTVWHWHLWPLYLVVALPQLLMGLILGYVRVRMGFAYALLLHIIINTPVVIMQIIRYF